jgi:hypothetical protein
MPRGYRLAVSGDQIDAIRNLVLQTGIRARRIFLLNLPVLGGLNEGNIQRIIGREGLVDPLRGEHCRNAYRISSEKRGQVLAYLLGEGRDLSDLEVARVMRISKQSVIWLRMTRIGKWNGPRRISQVIEGMRRQKIALTRTRMRAQRWEDLSRLQNRLEAEGCGAPIRECKVCTEKRFELPNFFYRTSGGGYFRTCTICMSEIDFLKNLGKRPDEIRQIMQWLIWRQPAKTASQLTGQFLHDSILHCNNSLVFCATCKQQWYYNGNYFHTDGVNGNRTLLDVCLACPVKRARRKFCLPEEIVNK